MYKLILLISLSVLANINIVAAHDIICADTGLQKAMIFDKDGKLVWQYDKVQCVDVSALPNGNILMCHESPKDSWVREVRRSDKKTVWEYKVKGEAQSCQRLPNGNTLIGKCTGSELIEVTPNGKIAKRIKVTTSVKKTHKILRRARKGVDGLYYVAHHGEGACRVYDGSGNVVREIPHYPGFCYSATPLKDGKILLTGKDLMKIVDKDNKIIWSLRPDEVAKWNIASFCGADVQDNGNIIVSNWLGHGMEGKGTPIIEVTPDKRVVWSFGDTKQTRQVLGVQVID
ncbi:MAG: beta-propeller domain-containing protein [Pirellulales bacterium]